MVEHKTTIIAPPSLEGIFRFLTPGKSCADQVAEYGADWIARQYEAHKCLVIDDYPLDFDREFFWRLPMLGGSSGEVLPTPIKKLKYGAVMAKITKPFNEETHVLGKWVKPAEHAFHLQDQTQKIRAQLQQMCRDLFPRYERIEEERGFSIRLTVQAGEEIHFDSYMGMDDDHSRIRVFANLDCRPRIWATAGTLDQWLPRVADEYFHKNNGRHPNDANDFIGGAIRWDDMPLAYMHFGPCSVWFVDSQPVSHEITYGRRMASHTTVFRSESRLDPASAFTPWARRLWESEARRRAGGKTSQ